MTLDAFWGVSFGPFALASVFVLLSGFVFAVLTILAREAALFGRVIGEFVEFFGDLFCGIRCWLACRLASIVSSLSQLFGTAGFLLAVLSRLVTRLASGFFTWLVLGWFVPGLIALFALTRFVTRLAAV